MPSRKRPEPTNKKLYEQVKREAKRRFKVWPSAYASSWFVNIIFFKKKPKNII